MKAFPFLDRCVLRSSQTKYITLILILFFKDNSLDNLLFIFLSPCQPHHQCYNATQNKNSHYNKMHQYIFSLTATTILSQRSYYLLILSVFCLDRKSWSVAHAAVTSFMHIFARDTLISSDILWNIPFTFLVFFPPAGIKST